jgi:hypothetical protein
MSRTVPTEVTMTNKSSVSRLPDMLHHWLDDEGGGRVEMCAGRTPIEESEIKVEGEFSPSHSIELVSMVAPDGLPHILTDISRTASRERTVVTALVAVTIKFKRLARVIV